MGDLNKFLIFGIILVLFNNSLEQIIIPLNPMHSENEPTIVTRESFTVRGNDGTPITVTRINIRRNSKNLNGGERGMHTPLELMRLMDERISSIFEEIISQRIGLKVMFNDFRQQNQNKEENNKEENNKEENNKNDEEKNKEENKENIDEKEFELDENPKEEEKKDKIIEQEKDQNKTEGQNITEENKDNKKAKNNKVIKNKKEKKEKKEDDNKTRIGKLKVNPDALKPKKKKKKLSRKEIIFSRVCKYIFYSIILFTIYILVRKLLELLEIIDPETNIGLKDVKVNNNPNNKDKEEENKNKEDDIILNKKKENKLN